MSGLIGKAMRFARSPQGRKALNKAQRYVKSPEGKERIEGLKEKISSHPPKDAPAPKAKPAKPAATTPRPGPGAPNA